jgi:hypothetical protein
MNKLAAALAIFAIIPVKHYRNTGFPKQVTTSFLRITLSSYSIMLFSIIALELRDAFGSLQAGFFLLG